MNLEMTAGFREAIVPILSSCGGATGPMHNIATRIKRSRSNDLAEILGALVDAPGPIREIIETCEETNGKLDLEGLIRHFSSFSHTTKMSGLKVTVARELPESQIPLAHTLLPLTIIGGKYYYDCGNANVEIVGLVQLGPSVGSPYAHLAGLMWFRDGGLHTKIMTESAVNGLSEIAKNTKTISYMDAPRLRGSTLSAAAELQSKG